MASILHQEKVVQGGGVGGAGHRLLNSWDQSPPQMNQGNERTDMNSVSGLPQHPQSKLLLFPTPSDNGLISTRPGGGW